ncbi:translation initiation factor eIF3 subunit [Perkinsus chesapeaki]|uniref:Serine-threonine kinase receptor-associated protein n=1 Tax=Perkinsus chesapeaki TaxID=330153 RepID=A0A7J6LX81_PERCH|nr:translation initiation factor eIF3 subunit [Perkinsus chesapeaki]
MVKGVVRCVEWCTNPNKQDRFIACRDQFVSTPNSVSIWQYNDEEQTDDDNKLNIIVQISGDNLPGKALQARWGLYDETIITIHDEKSDKGDSIFIWNANTGDKIQEIEHAHERQHVMIGGGQQARDVTTTSAKQGKFEACLHHMIYESELGKVSGHFGPINTLSWSPDGFTFVSGGEDGYVRVHHMDEDYTKDGGKKWGDDL